MNKTLDYYNNNAQAFVDNTLKVDFAETQNRFLSYLQKDAFILDFGCGSGRDTKYFLDKGFKVDAVDGSNQLCKLATEFTGIKVRQMLFDELDDVEKYDGIWACASILHVKKDELKSVIEKMVRALKFDGIIYTSFKYSQFEGERNFRFFTDFTYESFEEFISDMEQIEIIEHWITGDVREGRDDEKWLNIILRKHYVDN